MTLDGKVVLITGGTDGIGKATAIGLARLGASLVVVGRDPARGEAAVMDIRRESGNGRVDLLLADLALQAEIRRLAREVSARYDRLDVLLNNVGGLYTRRWETAEGIEATFAMNVLGPFLLTHLLLPLLRRSAPARIVNVSGGVPMGTLSFDDLQGERKYSSFRVYSKTKLANLLWTFELARRLEGSGVTANVVYPGGADTPMTQAMSADAPAIMRLIGPIFRRAGLAGGPPARAAVSSIRAASDPALAHVTGRYFKPSGEEGRPPRGSTNEVAARRLLMVCEQLTGRTDGVPEHAATKVA